MSGKLSKAAGPVTESFLSRTIFAPILFVSFLISLVLVDRTTSAEVFRHGDHQHEHDNARRPSSSPSHNATHEKEKEDYYHSHQRKLMKREAEDAFALRQKVIAAMIVCLALGMAVLAWSGVEVWEFVVPHLRWSRSTPVAG